MKLLFAIFSVCTLYVQSVAQDTAGLYPFTSTRQVTKEDVQDKSLQDLKIMRNEVFARHGHTFKSADLKAHFGAQPWYKPTTADASSLLTPVEKQNVEFIRKWETKITTTSDFDDFFAVFTKAVESNDMDKMKDLVVLDFYSSFEEFQKSYDMHEAEFSGALADADIISIGKDEARLPYGEYYSGTQSRFIVFKRVGCCWYVQGFMQAG